MGGCSTKSLHHTCFLSTHYPHTCYHDGLHFWQFMISGSIAGMVEHMSMFPIDTIKTRMQVLGSCPIKSVGLRQALHSILKSDGPAGLYQGIGAMGLGAGPAHAVYFSNFSAWDLIGGIFALVLSY
ncbi:hypothetical protein SSX86_018715 [Deinandra increscens subsp. villosa]|uniref:Uncharacterized protein n=1 Tax=Deinandra increscens subsp. villosa TaxID=3103831 RepID=A0AAP0CVS0_9ASTR